MIPERKIFQPVPPRAVCLAYELLYSRGLVSFPIASSAEDKIDSLVATIIGSYFGHEIYASSEEKAVAYLYFLIKDHPFIDGNKRTASLVFSIVCHINGLFPKFGDNNPWLDELAVFIEKTKETDHHLVIHWIATMLFS